jgi:O-antigen/teichoic acid export membrane protein
LITTPLLPALSRAQTRADLEKALRHALAAALLLVMPCSAMLAAIAPAVPDLFHWPVEFRNSIPLMMILAMQQPLVAVDMVLGAAIIAQHKERRWLRMVMIAAAINIALNLVFIPLTEHLWANGAIGSAIVTILSEFVVLGAGLLLLPRGMLGRESLSTALRVFLAGAVLFGVSSTLLPINLLLAMVAGGLAYAIAVIVFGALRLSELRTILQSARRAVGTRFASTTPV